jgi:predicted DNA-binding transcriptional regulator AlpA
MAKNSNDDDFPLDEGEAAKLIGSARPTLAKMRRQGRGPQFFKVGERIRYLRGSVLKWRAEQAGSGREG